MVILFRKKDRIQSQLSRFGYIFGTRAYANGTQLTTALLFTFVDFLFPFTSFGGKFFRGFKFVAVLSVIGSRMNKMKPHWISLILALTLRMQAST